MKLQLGSRTRLYHLRKGGTRFSPPAVVPMVFNLLFDGLGDCLIAVLDRIDEALYEELRC